MPHIATKINCDGEKCGECEKLSDPYDSAPNIDEILIGGKSPVLTKKRKCILFGKEIIDDNRLPECLAGELVEDCQTCGHKQGVEFCDIRKITGNSKAYHFDCWDHNLKYWQPATKGEGER